MRGGAAYYVYALKDPRSNPAKPFYIGKGVGTRAWEHELKVDASPKGKIIAQIKTAGLQVITTKLVQDLTEAEAFKVEAELISAFGVQSRGGLLTNRVIPTGIVLKVSSDITVADGTVERAQISLQHLKDAVMELLRTNSGGLTNYEVARSLGLQSDYGGGSKNYLSYSILGILMREGQVQRLKDKKHVAVTK